VSAKLESGKLHPSKLIFVEYTSPTAFIYLIVYIYLIYKFMSSNHFRLGV